MSRTDQLVQALRDLGLTPTEAEVYIATIEAAAEGPVSGYRVAQGLGRDPANLAKVMAGLVRQGAVRIVQEKPRLYLPVDPEAFTAGIVERIRERREEAVGLLRRFAPADPGGAPLLVPTFVEAVATATGLIAGATSTVVLHAPEDIVAALAEPLAAAGARKGCRVVVLSPAPVRLTGVESTLVPAPEDTTPWLQLVTDRSRWLTARAGGEPAGAGGEQPAVAGVLADGLDVARRTGEFRAELAAMAAAGGGGDRPAAPQAAPKAADKPADEPAPRRPEGLDFLIRHDRDD
jgi:sugar-specific transcriptional regulator TrmB